MQINLGRIDTLKVSRGLPWSLSGWESARKCRGHGFDHWSGRIPHAVERRSPHITTSEPVISSPGAISTDTAVSEAHVLWGLCLPAREATAGKSSVQNQRVAHLAATGESLRAATKIRAPVNKLDVNPSRKMSFKKGIQSSNRQIQYKSQFIQIFSNFSQQYFIFLIILVQQILILKYSILLMLL